MTYIDAFTNAVLFFLASCIVALLLAIPFSIRAHVEEVNRVDKLCAQHGMASHDYRERRGKTLLGARLCVDANGQIFDPSEWSSK